MLDTSTKMMLWGCFFSKDHVNLVRIQGIMDYMKYQEIINKKLSASAKKLQLGCDLIIQ